VSVTWIKEGRLFEPQRQAPWVITHAALPVVQERNGGARLYFSSRDKQGRSHIGAADMCLSNPRRVLSVDGTALVSPGPLGAFDDAGVTSSCLVRHGERLFLYYTGWSVGITVPFYLSIGLAISDDDGRTFQRFSPGPLLDRNAVDPYLTASPWIIVEDGVWRMWYVSATEWQSTAAGVRHKYHIRYGESKNGIAWDRSGPVCIDYASAAEYAFGRPCVIRQGSGYRMWYSYRGDTYRIGYAESSDGLSWTRRDSGGGLDVSPSGWDSEMVTYPLVLCDGDGLLMLYNGNGYGRTGIGVARSR
jgi:hypothetical protein